MLPDNTLCWKINIKAENCRLSQVYHRANIWLQYIYINDRDTQNKLQKRRLKGHVAQMYNNTQFKHKDPLIA